MKKIVALLLACALVLTLCACGGSYTAVPELKLSWDMSPEMAQKANSFKTMYVTREDGYSFISSEPGQKLPRIAGVPVSQYMCVFDNGKMIQVIVFTDGFETENGKIVSYDYNKVVDCFTKEYGQPTMEDSGSAGLLADGTRAVWVLDGRAIEIKGSRNIVQQVVFYANADEAADAPEESEETEPEPAETGEQAPDPAASTAESESPEEWFFRIIREKLSGKWISVNNGMDELMIDEEGAISINETTYLIDYMEEYEEEKEYWFEVADIYALCGFYSEDDVICASELPGMEDFDFVYFVREGTEMPGEPFYGTWTLKSGEGLTWEGTAAKEITVLPEGELLLDGRDIGLGIVLYPEDPNFTYYRWVIKRQSEDGSSFGIFFENANPVPGEDDTILVIDQLGRSFYQRS